MKIKERGYYTLKWGNNEKTMHFSRLFMNELYELTGMDIITFGVEIQKAETLEDQFKAIAAIVHSGFLAYDKEEGNDIDYNEHKVGNWLAEACVESDKVLTDILDTLQSASRGKTKGSNQTPKKKKRKKKNR